MNWKLLARLGCAIALLAASGAAISAFHLWRINEVYSNASGTVQFIEFTSVFGGQQFIGGHTLSAIQSGTTRTFTFPANLPGDSANKKFLVGTQGFAALGIVTPDYIIPDGFLFVPSGTIDFSGVDFVSYLSLPTDGVLSIDRNGATAVNSPTNFAGQSGSIAGAANTVPGAPAIGTATPGNGQASISFSPPAADGGATIIDYTATCNPGGLSAAATASPISVTGLTNGITYNCAVTARNSVGPGPASASTSVTPATVPGAPTGLSAIPGDSQATISFAAPAANGATITGYQVVCNSGNVNASGQSSPITVFGLANGNSYSCSVSASNSAGTGPASARIDFVPATIPGPPTSPTAVAGNGQISLSFSPPTTDGGSAIQSYTATCNPGGITQAGAGNTLVVSGLANGTAYACSVSASNAIGTGPASVPVRVIPATVPAAPGIGTPIAGNGRVFIPFTAPATNGGAPITSYLASCTPGGNGSGVASPITIAGLVNGTPYSCDVRAINSAGTGPASASSSVTPILAPGLALVSVRSRKAHGNAGMFDLTIDQSASIGGNITIEPRLIGSGHTLVFEFNDAITSVNGATTTDVTGNPVGMPSAAIAGNSIVVSLTGVPDRQRLNVALSGVNGALNVAVALGFLIGDVNTSFAVNAGDIIGVKVRNGNTTNIANFQFDLNASGTINQADVSVAKARSGSVLLAPPVNVCIPNPCTTPPPNSCTAGIQTTYLNPGICTAPGPICTYSPTQTNVGICPP